MTPLSIGRTLGLVAVAATLAAPVAVQAQETLKIGFAAALTEYLAPYDQPSLKGIELGVDEVNAAGGIGGKIKLELLVKDTRSDTAQSGVAAQELIDEGVQFLVTNCDVDPSVAAGTIAQAANVPAISSCASTPTLPGIVGPFMFLNYTADNLQAAVLAGYARDQGYQNAYILLSRDTPYTEKLPEYFGQVFQAKGGTLLGTGEYAMGQQDFSAEVTKIKALDPQPDVIMTSAYEPDFPAFIKQLRASGIATPVLGSDGIDSPTTLGLGEVAEGVVYTNAGFPVPGTPLADFYAKYEAKYGEPLETTYAATGYDIIKVLEAAVLAAGSVDGKAIRDAMDNLKDVAVATGTMTFAGRDRVPLRTVTLIKVSAGQRVHLASVNPDPADVPAP